MKLLEFFHIDEALNSSYPYEFKNGNYYFTTDTGAEYKVMLTGTKKVEVSFVTRDKDGQVKDTITGTGDSRKVFGTVINIVKEYVNSNNPEILVFAASNAEPSRIRLYNALAAQASRALPGYTFAKTLKLSSFTTFYLTRDNIKVPKVDTAKNAAGKALDAVFEDDDEYEIRNLDKLDHILIKLADMVIRGQKKDPEYFGMVAACVLDPDNNIVARLNCPDKDGKRIHAERAAMVAYYKQYGEIPKGSIIITTLSPCCEHMDDRAGESCTDLINNSPVHKVYCGYSDPTQDEHDDRQFTLQETNNPKIRAVCEQLADTFLDNYDEAFDIGMGQASHGKAGVDENFKDGRHPEDKGDSRRHGIPKHATLSQLDKIAHQGGRKGQLAHWQANMRRGRKKANESIEVEEFKEILKKFLPIAKKIVKLDKLPTIILRKQLKHEDQPTQGRYHGDSNTLEISVAGRQPVDVLRTLAHELTHARQQQDHVDIDPTTGSPEENEANVTAGIVMRHFNKMYPEYLEYQPLAESGNNGRKRIC